MAEEEAPAAARRLSEAKPKPQPVAAFSAMKRKFAASVKEAARGAKHVMSSMTKSLGNLGWF